MNTDKVKRLVSQPTRVDRWMGRIVGFVQIGFVVYVALWLSLSAGDHHWPYDVMERRLLTPTVEPGDSLVMRRVIDYHDVDCWRQYDRRAVSKTGDGRMYRFAPVVEQRLPGELSGKPQSWSEDLPLDFPCGPAYLVETITAACTWWQRNVRRLHKPDVITPFEVVGCQKP